MKLKIISFLILCSSVCCAQGFKINSLLRSGNQQIIESAVKDGLFVMESYYQLEDSTGQRFGLDGKAYFNEMEYAGFAIDGFAVVPEKVFKPWKEDNSVNQYLDAYKPVLYEVKMRNIQDSVATSIDSLSFGDTIRLCTGYIAMQKKEVQGLAIDTARGDKDGWLILAVKNNNTVSMQCIRKPVPVESNEEQVLEFPTAFSTVLGGIYVVPEVERVGSVVFKLCGIVQSCEGGNRLTVLFPFVSQNYANRLKTASKGGKLHPIKTADDKLGDQKDINSQKKK